MLSSDFFLYALVFIRKISIFLRLCFLVWIDTLMSGGITMKKRIYQTITLLLTVSILTVNASAGFIYLSAKENFIWKCLMTGQSTCWNKYISVLSTKSTEKLCVTTSPIAQPACTEAEKATTPTNPLPTESAPAEQPAKDEPIVQAPKADSPSTQAPSTGVSKSEAPTNETQLPSNPSIFAYEAEVIQLVNDIREQNGLRALTANADLCRVARLKSQDMVDKNYFSHTSPTYGSPFDMMKTFGITYHTAGENIAYGYPTPESVVNGWMNSEGHRKNILNSSFTEIGVGYVSNGNYWTQMFIG
jgi:uncharacterized YkwD family protein